MKVLIALAALALTAQTAPEFATGAELKAKVAAVEAAMKPGQGFAWEPLVKGGEAVAAVEVWRKPGLPAVHPDEAEYATVVAGAGTLVSGGRLVEPVERRPGLVEGQRIEGGTTRQIKVGDVFLIPAGAPHWFGVTGGRLVLLGTKIRQR
jgi:mannose-6-phosphate isomerase-like protein (cupin superfamily)